ncbi:transketolase [Pseudonocardia autotrophica]|uniref:Transketolase 2 n=2 Tax=Pseudonocardia TaxID=1847 RepID=A0A1Y2MJE9_PSEAH|nr:Transketolase 2 [Pseudonocardia autotrophica]TDN76934.1 transketolase [Pseudonocardia autotrophica]BBG00938.1 transketolase [Pseudonocardia autotrophica]GEC29060.1 transketolase [Pseudonocardia saturnea]
MPTPTPTPAPVPTQRLADRALFVRTETVRLTRIAGAGHYSAVFSCAEILAALYYSELRIDPARPDWADRDRFVMSKGHAAIGLYPVLADLGYFDPELLDDYTRLGSAFGDHPDMKRIPGIDFSSGSLGHGLSIGVGMAWAGRHAGSDHRTWCLLGDGELAEGQIWEAAMAAAHFGLGDLVAVVDNNQLGIDGFVADIMPAEPVEERFAAFGWDTHRVDGHDLDVLRATFAALPGRGGDRPQLIVADTVKGKGVARMELSPDWHVGNLAGADFDDVMTELNR